MNEIKVFNNAEFGEIRTLEINGEPYFIGKDVATILGYKNIRDAIAKHVDDDDKDDVAIRDSIGRMQNTTVINESGLYSLILSSKLSTAKKFKRYVTSEVLPSIRKTGSYSSSDYQGLSPQLQYLITLEKKQNALEAKQTELENRIEEAKELKKDEIQEVLEYSRISSALAKQISKAVKTKCIQVCQFAGTYEAVGKKVESKIYKDLQKLFNVPSYKDLCYYQLNNAWSFIITWQPDVKTHAIILNNFPYSDILSSLDKEAKENEED